MKKYFTPALCFILLSVSACKTDLPMVPSVSTLSEVWAPSQNGINPEEDLRSDYQTATKTISVDMGKVEAHLKMWEDIQASLETKSHSKVDFSEIRLNALVLVPRPFQETTWETFLEDLNVVFIPDDGTPSTVLANLASLGPIENQADFGFNMTIIEQNLVDLLFEKPGSFSLDFLFTGLPDDKISLITTQFYFTGKYQTSKK